MFSCELCKGFDGSTGGGIEINAVDDYKMGRKLGLFLKAADALIQFFGVERTIEEGQDKTEGLDSVLEVRQFVAGFP